MKKPSTDLYHLVQSLNSKERNTLLQSISGSSRLTQLFKELWNQKKYDETKVLDSFKGEISKSILSTLKYDLQSRILETIVQLKPVAEDSHSVLSLVQSANVLSEKGLVLQAKKRLEKASQIAEKGGLIIETALVLEAQRELALAITDTDLKVELVNKKIPNLRADLIELADYIGFLGDYDELFLSGDARIIDPNDDFVKTCVERLEQLDESKYNDKTKVLYYQTLAMGYFKLNRVDNTIEELKKVINLYEGNEVLMMNQFNDYLKVKFNVLSVNVIDGSVLREMEVLNTIELVKRYRKKNSSLLVASKEVRGYVLLAEVYQFQNKHKDCVEATKLAEKTAHKLGEELNQLQKIIIDFMRFQAYFHLGEYRQSLKSANSILNRSDKKIRVDIQRFMKVGFLILQYELGNFEELRYYLDSARKYYKDRSPLVQTEVLTIKLLKGLLNTRKPNADAITEFRTSLDQLQKENVDTTLRLYFDFDQWLNRLTARN